MVVSAEMETEAKIIRKKRDDKYGNIYLEYPSDERWVGDLGEICINRWIQGFGYKLQEDYKWILNNVSGEPDFIIHGYSLDVKTVKRKVAPQRYYTAQITAKHISESCNYYFFCSYEIRKKTMWLLGGVGKEEFIKAAKYYKAGDWVHSKYQIRPGHEIYNIEISKLKSPSVWAEQIGIMKR